ncbi:sugar phosphate nucleotidyltransferase [Bremerella sp. P1]|uniref:sugar phosphate nucleotidyltransferase n=1 Tax=Bremerella sp. P1 TaxID=3026424 RepID=UPI002368B561|nr:sugar phosphate nucleotidyltransferase [Bremerella sp. P1]WDI43867.1 sugar phosphate nucleotidyltransferase [Bremerella sp. P1]
MNAQYLEDSKLKRMFVDPSASIIETMRVVDEASAQIALVVEGESTLIGVVTDGDLRRAILRGSDLSDPVLPFTSCSFHSVPEGATRAQALDLMQSLGLKHLPIVDDEMQIRGIHLLSEVIKPQVLPNAALILAGGKGTRLGKITANVPKPMIQVAGRPILERIVLLLVGSGIRKIFIAVNHFAEQIEEYFGDGSQFGCEIILLYEESPLGTGGPLGLLRPYELQDPLLVMNGDLVTDFDAQAMIRAHHSHENYITIGVRNYSHEIPFGCLEIEDGQVVSIAEKPIHRTTINSGIYVVDPEVTRAVTPRFLPFTDILNDAIQNSHRLGAFEIADWIDVGLPDQLAQARGH